MEELILNPKIIEAIGNLSIGVISILSLAFIIKWLSESHKMLSESHKRLADSNEKISRSHEKLTKTVNSVAKSIKKDVDLTKSLISEIEKKQCHFKTSLKKHENT